MKFAILCVMHCMLLPYLAYADDSIVLTEPGLPQSGPQQETYSVENFSFSDINGKKHEFNENHGKWVIVNYWATYCPPCRVEVTDLDMFARANKEKVVILGMDTGGDTPAALKEFKKDNNISYALIPSQENTLLAFGIVEAIPTTFIVSPDGQITGRHTGMITYDDLEDSVNPHKPIQKQKIGPS